MSHSSASESSSSASVSWLLSSYVPISELFTVSRADLIHVSQSESFFCYYSPEFAPQSLYLSLFV